ncbi:MAG: hypothetical protein O7H39_02510 [Gammaproteobacteria bacterium]|nr:hypothetical protein [Gammaproteobacteria bacterium]
MEPLLIWFFVFGGDLGSEIDRLERLLGIDLSRWRISRLRGGHAETPYRPAEFLVICRDGPNDP